MAYYLLNENGTDRYLLEDDSGLLLIEEQFGPPGGQVTSTGQGSVAKVLTIALIGLSVAVGQGTVAAQNADGAAGLTGAESTTATGSLTPSHDRALIGRSITLSQGAVYGTGRSLMQSDLGTAIADFLVPLSGQGSTVEQGLITPNADGTVPLIGSVGTLAQGTVATPNDVPLTGAEGTLAAGTVVPGITPSTPTGQSVTSAHGTVTIEANNVTVNITGEESVFGQGVLDSRPILTGQVTTSADGSVVPSADVALTGTASTLSQGTVGIGQDPDDTYILSASGTQTVSATVPLTGTALTSASGTVTVSNDVFQPITGSESTSASGTVGVEAQLAVVGASLTGLQANVGAPGGAVLTGQVINGQQGTVATTEDRESALTGVAVTLSTGTLAANPRVALTGHADLIEAGFLGPVGGAMQQALTGLSFTGGTGTVGVTGPVTHPPGVSNEGCGITSGVAAEQNQPASQTGGEGCFIQSGTAREV